MTITSNFVALRFKFQRREEITIKLLNKYTNIYFLMILIYERANEIFSLIWLLVDYCVTSCAHRAQVIMTSIIRIAIGPFML